MAAITLKQARQILGTYVEPDGDFTASLNQVLARIMNSGTYRDLTVQYTLPLVDGVVTLPDDADSILHVMVDGLPAPVRSLWHDFKNMGSYSNVTFGFIDCGFWPTVWMPDTSESPIGTLYVAPMSLSGVTAFSPSSGESIVVRGINSEFGTTDITYDDVDGEYPVLLFTAGVNTVTGITFDGLLGRYDLRTDRTDPATTIATVGPDSGTTRYRKFRLSPLPDTDSHTIHVLCKRAFQPLVLESDVLPVSNINALKQGLLARIADDNADIERAKYHWDQCVQSMEDEANSTMGAAVPRLNLDPFGLGNTGSSRMINLY